MFDLLAHLPLAEISLTAGDCLHVGADVVLGIGLFIVGRKASKADSLEARVAKNSEDIIDAKFKVHAAENMTAITLLKSMCADLKESMQQGTQELDEQDEKKQKLEIKTSTQISDLKSWVSDQCASKRDVERLGEQLTQLRIDMASAFPGVRRMLPPLESTERA